MSYTRYRDYEYYKERENTLVYYIKLWVISILVLSIIVIIIQIVYNYDIRGPRSQVLKDAIDFKYVKSITPKYPPPLLADYFE